MEAKQANNSFPPSRRLHTRGDYGRVFHRQQKAVGKYLVLLCAPRRKKAPSESRLGIMVSTKVHKRAVRRHQLKRWVREWFRCGGHIPAQGHDIVVLFRADFPTDGHDVLVKELDRLLKKVLHAKPGQAKRRQKK